MTFSERIETYIQALIFNTEKIGSELPLRSTAAQRSKRMDSRERALDWRVQIQDSCRVIRNTHRVFPDPDIERLLYLLGEHYEAGYFHDE